MLDSFIAEFRRLVYRRIFSRKSTADAARNRGEWAVAADAYRNYLALEPSDAAAHNDLGITYCELGQFMAARGAFATAAARDPGLVSAHLNLGHLALQQHRAYREAVSHYLAVLQIDPGQPDARRQISLAYYELGEVANALHYLEPLPGHPIDLIGAEYSLFMKNALPSRDLREHYQEHLRWAGPFDLKSAPALHARQLNKTGSAGRIRIGYVSADFREHAVVRFLLPALERLNQREFEVFCYANQSDSDSVTLAIQQMPVAWRSVFALSDEQVVDLIAADRIDILVDLSGHTRGNRLGVFAMKPAEIQATWLGYLNTTGLSAMDYRITDSLTDPPDVADRFHTEKLIRLDPSSWCYRAPDDSPAVGTGPCESSGHITFASFNHVAKVNDGVIECWSRILEQCPGGRLKLFGVPDESTCARLVGQFRTHGIGPERLQIVARLSRMEFLAEMAQTDIALDPFPYCGGATTCESLWMGLPVIALAGEFGFSRSSSAIIAQTGLDGCIAVSREDYVQKALALADGGIKNLRTSMRDRLRTSELMNENGFVNRLEAGFRTMLGKGNAQ